MGKRLDQARLVVWFVAWRLVVAVSMRLGGFDRTRRRMRLDVVREPGAVADRLPSRAVEVARVFVRASRWPLLRSSCLPDALVLERLLRAEGVAADVIIGVAGADDPKAHAWVEVAGVPIKLEDAQGTFRQIGRFAVRRR